MPDFSGKRGTNKSAAASNKYQQTLLFLYGRFFITDRLAYAEFGGIIIDNEGWAIDRLTIAERG